MLSQGEIITLQLLGDVTHSRPDRARNGTRCIEKRMGTVVRLGLEGENALALATVRGAHFRLYRGRAGAVLSQC